MTRQLTLVFLLVSLLCSGQTFKSRLDSLVNKYDSLGSYNGVIIVAFGPDSIETFEYGYKDPIIKKETISMNDRFDLASLTKQFTGLAILQLIEKKIINENDPISKYLPELKPNLGKVTIKQLANHTNGIHDFYSLTTKHDTLSSEKIMKILSLIDSTVFSPGSHWGYSNSGYFLLSTIVERATNCTFQNYCCTNILTPLGMDSATFAPADNVLKGFDLESNSIIYNSFSSGESGLYATGNDMISYYKTVVNTRKWKKYFELSNQLSDISNTENWNYGFGWFLSKDSIGKFRAHSGRNSGADTYIRWYDDKNLFVCLLANKRLVYFKELREDISNLIVEEYKMTYKTE